MSHLSYQPSKPVYYIEDCQISGEDPRTPSYAGSNNLNILSVKDENKFCFINIHLFEILFQYKCLFHAIHNYTNSLPQDLYKMALDTLYVFLGKNIFIHVIVFQV